MNDPIATHGERIYVAYREGVFWNVTTQEESVKDWLERDVIECYRIFEPVSGLFFADNVHIPADQ